jgi:ABC-type transport system involved in multi-copper enzyme maturation permease subunit
MTQTWAIFYDAYRALNAKKMFWIVLAISGLVVAGMGCLGINEQGVTIAFWQVDFLGINSHTWPPPLFYKSLFLNFGVGLWLTWIATILALVSTAGVFPDLITSGSIDLVVSKPISRLRLFLTQYAAALLFVTLQVTIFSVASFLVLGLRGGVWEPGLFIGVPLVVCFYSYLFSVCVLLGILRRSTVAALLLTLLFWAFVGGLGWTENWFLVFRTAHEQGVSLIPPPPNAPKPAARAGQPPDRSDWVVVTHKVLYGLKTVLPKTGETLNLMDRTMVSMAELSEATRRRPGNRPSNDVGLQVEQELRSRSVAWIVGTSLAFEAVILAWAAWVFCRRDY